MKVWVVNVGEHVPVLTGRGRTMRAGMLADYFSQNEEDDVTWWLSTFLHYEKRYYSDHSFERDVKPNMHLKILHVDRAYKNNISLKRILYYRNLAKKLRNAFKKEIKPDVIYCSWPVIELCAECIRYGKINDIPVVVDIRDFWPDNFTQPFHGIAKRIAEIGVEIIYGSKTRYVMKNADKVIGIVPKTMELAEKYGRNLRPIDHPVYLCYRRCNCDDNKKIENSKLRDFLQTNKDCFIVTYFGSINNRIDDIGTILEAAKNCKSPNVRFVICGQGLAFDEMLNLSKNCENVILPGWVNSFEIQQLASASSVGLLPYRNMPDFVDSLPNKFAEYISYGLPVLTSLKGLSRTVVEEKNCGNYFSGADELNEILERYQMDKVYWEQQRENAFKLYDEQFNADYVYAELLNEFKQMVEDRKQIDFSIQYHA